MKLKNKKTGQVGNFIINKDHFECVDLDYVPEYRNITELNAEWEDYEEPKKYWLISPVDTDAEQAEMEGDAVDTFNKQIGNYFETREDAEKAIEKLKAWRRLRDQGFYFKRWHRKGSYIELHCKEYAFLNDENKRDLDLLFGTEKLGEE